MIHDDLTTEIEEDLECVRRWGFRAFVELAWPILEPATPFVPNWHIDCVTEHLQAVSDGQLRRVIFNVPPGSAKSLLVSVLWPTFHWIQHPADRFLTASYTDVLSLRDALKSRRLIQSRWYQALWGDRFSMTGDQNAKSRYENDKTGYRIATHVGGATGERAKVKILDDPHNIEEAESDTVREGVIDWVRHTWLERESDATTSADICVMQRLHERDVSGFLLNEVGGYEHVMLPMRFEPMRRCQTSVGWSDPRTQPNELLFPVRWDEEAVRFKERRLGAFGTACQLQQRPAPEEGGILKRHWWRYWQYPGQALPPVLVKQPNGEYLPVKPIPLPTTFESTLQSWDLTFEGGVQCDYVVGQQYGKRGATSYLLDQFRDQVDFVASLSAIRAFHQRHLQYNGPKLIEKKANGAATIATLQREIPGFIPHPGNDDKIARAHAYAYLVEAGNVVLPHPQIAPWVQTFIDELATYPNASHDDQCIAWSQAMDKLYKALDGIPITPEFSAKYHVADVLILMPIPGRETIRLWAGGLHPTCVVLQLLGDGQIHLLDAVQLKNGGMRQLIRTRLKPLLARPRYERVTRWRDIGAPALNELDPQNSEQRPSVVIEEELKTTFELGVRDWYTRRESLKELFARNVGGKPMLSVNPRASEGESTNLLVEALGGGYRYPMSATGAVNRDGPIKDHHAPVGDALSHGLPVLLFPAQEPQRRGPSNGKAMERSKGYAVR